MRPRGAGREKKRKFKLYQTNDGVDIGGARIEGMNVYIKSSNSNGECEGAAKKRRTGQKEKNMTC